MKAYLITILISYTLADNSAPYAPSGVRPSGPIFELPKSFQISQPHTEYGVPNRPNDQSKTNINNEYSYRTINLPQNQYGSPQKEVRKLQTNYVPTSNSANEPLSRYNSPQANNRFTQSITQQQLPKLETSKFRNLNNVQQYGTPNNRNNVDIVPSIEITTQANNQPQNRYDDEPTTNQNRESNFQNNNENDFIDTKNSPRKFYNSPDNGNNEGVGVKTSDVDLRFGSNDPRRRKVFFNSQPNNFNNNEAGSFGDVGQDGYYNNPTNQPEEETITTTISPENNDYDENNSESNNNDGSNVAVSTAIATGQYYILQPDGHLQRVTFKTVPNENDKNNGFSANLIYENVEPIRDPIYTYDQNLILMRVSK